jgi:hypothetical protein
VAQRGAKIDQSMRLLLDHPSADPAASMIAYDATHGCSPLVEAPAQFVAGGAALLQIHHRAMTSGRTGPR